jgi:predicted N-acetyltransferase YhbS
VTQPGDADAITDGEFVARLRANSHYFGDHFVSRYDVGPVYGQVSLGNMQIGAAHAAGPHRDQQLIRRG